MFRTYTIRTADGRIAYHGNDELDAAKAYAQTGTTAEVTRPVSVDPSVPEVPASGLRELVARAAMLRHVGAA